MDDDLDALARFATEQHGNVTPKQMRSAGFSNAQVRHRIAERVLERAGTHVVRSPFVERTPIGDLAALVLDVGGDAVASGITALALHGADGVKLEPPYHVTTSRGRNIDRPCPRCTCGPAAVMGFPS